MTAQSLLAGLPSNREAGTGFISDFDPRFQSITRAGYNTGTTAADHCRFRAGAPYSS
jgi:hypothetical protein